MANSGTMNTTVRVFRGHGYEVLSYQDVEAVARRSGLDAQALTRAMERTDMAKRVRDRSGQVEVVSGHKLVCWETSRWFLADGRAY